MNPGAILTTCRSCGYADTTHPACTECGFRHGVEEPVLSSSPGRVGRDLAVCVVSGLLQVLALSCFAVFAIVAIVDSVTGASQTWTWLEYLPFLPLAGCSLLAGVRVVGLRHLGIVPGWVHAGVVLGSAAVAMALIDTELYMPFVLFPNYGQRAESVLAALGLGLLTVSIGVEHERIATAVGTPEHVRAARTTTRGAGVWVSVWALCTPLVFFVSILNLSAVPLSSVLSAGWFTLICVYGYYAYRSGASALASVRRARFRAVETEGNPASGGAPR